MSASTWANVAGAGLVLSAGAWLSSGTLSPLANVSDLPLVLENCHYLVDIDWGQHIAPFLMLEGEPRELWAPSVVLRRILYPLVALPFMKWLGFLVGALVFNVLMTLATVYGFSAFVYRRAGRRSALVVMWLLATYPGIAYSIAMPYAYAAIVPATLLCHMALYWAYEAKRLRWSVLAALLIGLMFLAYDLIPFFLPALALSQLLRRRWSLSVLLPVTALLPSVLLLMLYARLGIPLANSNTSTYAMILGSYGNVDNLSLWWSELTRMPSALVTNYFFSTFFFLPVLALVAFFAQRRKGLMSVPDVALVVAILAVFLFNNAAPPYLGWQMRGDYIARLYQPLFVVLLLVVARAVMLESRLVVRAAAAAVALNFLVVLTPILGTPVTGQILARYYLTAPVSTMDENLDAWGRRPLGFCQRTHEGDELQRSRGVYQRPDYMFRG
jgi:hypothetical protein